MVVVVPPEISLPARSGRKLARTRGGKAEPKLTPKMQNSPMAELGASSVQAKDERATTAVGESTTTMMEQRRQWAHEVGGEGAERCG